MKPKVNSPAAVIYLPPALFTKNIHKVRFTTLRNTVAEASATDTQKYLMTLCREEDSKNDLGNKGHMKNSGDSTMATIGGKHYSGCVTQRTV